MTPTQQIISIFEQSGMKVRVFAECLGITYQGFRHMLEGRIIPNEGVLNDAKVLLTRINYYREYFAINPNNNDFHEVMVKFRVMQAALS